MAPHQIWAVKPHHWSLHRKNSFSVWRMAGGGSVLHEGNSSCFLTLPGSLSHHLNNVGHISCSWQTQEKNTQKPRELPLGWTLALIPLLELTQAAPTWRHISASLPGLPPHVEEQSKLLRRLTNDLTSLIRVWGLFTYQASVLKQLRNVGLKGHVLALTKLGSR